MALKYTNHFLRKLEDLFSESDYMLRYERGTFKSGYCILKSNKVAVINKFYTTEGKINAIVDILREIELDTSGLSDKSKKTLAELHQTKLEI